VKLEPLSLLEREDIKAWKDLYIRYPKDISRGQKMVSQEPNPQNPQTEKVNETQDECDECGFELCTFTYVNVYKNPWNPSEVSIELIDNEDYPLFIARKFNLKDLGVTSTNELISKLENDKEFLLKVLGYFNKDVIKGDDFDCIDLLDVLSVYSICGKIKWNRDLNEKRILKIEKLKDGFRFGVEGDKCRIAWLVRQHPKDPEKVVISFEKEGEEFGFVIRDYDEFSVNRKVRNMCELYKYLNEEPWEAVWFITWEHRLEFDEVKVVNESGYEGFDFEMCKCVGCEEKKEEQEESEEERKRKEKEKTLNELLSRMSNESVKVVDVRANKEMLLNELPKAFIEASSRVQISLGGNTDTNDQSIEVPILKFNKVAEIVNNNFSFSVFEVPRINEKLEFIKISESGFQFCGFETEFRGEMIQFIVNVKGGVAFLLFNPHDTIVTMEVKYSKNKVKYIDLKPRKLYLFVYECPKWELELMKIFGPSQEYLNRLSEYVENIDNKNIEGLCHVILRLFSDANILNGSGKTYDLRLKIEDIISLYSMKVIQTTLKAINNQGTNQGLRLSTDGFPRSWQGRVCKVIVELYDYLLKGGKRENVIPVLLKALLVYIDVVKAVFMIMRTIRVNHKEVEEKVRNVELMTQKVLMGEVVEVSNENEDVENLIKRIDEKCRYLNDIFRINIEGMMSKNPVMNAFGEIAGSILLGDSLEIYRTSIQAMLGEFNNVNLNLKEVMKVELEKENGIFSIALEQIDKLVRLLVISGKENKKELVNLLTRALINYYEIVQIIATSKVRNIDEIKRELSNIDTRLKELEKGI
jgi:hypothetical protein